jgi:hypothetical protein
MIKKEALLDNWTTQWEALKSADKPNSSYQNQTSHSLTTICFSGNMTKSFSCGTSWAIAFSATTNTSSTPLYAPMQDVAFVATSERKVATSSKPALR